tara:strand:+ start:28 stop:342 length:315 start_codon:yes stop_codon:yes gene_type:complete
MNFYKLLSFITLIILFFSLAFVGTILYKSNINSVYPPNISKCPDGYTPSGSETCLGEPTYTVADLGDRNGNPGTGPTSEACAKKEWAEENMVNWDGLTNNNNIC